jgi:hypothetical protein
MHDVTTKKSKQLTHYNPEQGHLIRYEDARKALAACVRVDEVKLIRDRAMALKLYAQQRNDPRLLNDAIRIRMRAERRAGELLIEMKANGQRDNGKGNHKAKSQAVTPLPKLADLGVTKMQASRWMRNAKSPEAEFKRQEEAATKSAIEVINYRTKHRKNPSQSASIRSRWSLVTATIGALARVATYCWATAESGSRKWRMNRWIAWSRRLHIGIYATTASPSGKAGKADCNHLQRPDFPQ